MSHHDQPERSTALRRLDAFVGQWEVELVFPGDPPFKAQTQASFEWLDDRRFFLVYRLGTEGPGRQAAYCLIGGDDTMETYTVLYSDSRGVARLYQMSLRDGVWRQWRDNPSFAQRFSATFGQDGRTIQGKWEKSDDGVHWQHDFDLTYTKVAT